MCVLGVVECKPPFCFLEAFVLGSAAVGQCRLLSSELSGKF